MGLIVQAYLFRNRTPWDFIGESNVLCARRDRMSHESYGLAANRMCGDPTGHKEGQPAELRPKGGGSFNNLALAHGQPRLAGEAGHFVTAHCCAALASSPVVTHRFCFHLLTQRGLNQAKVQI